MDAEIVLGFFGFIFIFLTVWSVVFAVKQMNISAAFTSTDFDKPKLTRRELLGYSEEGEEITRSAFKPNTNKPTVNWDKMSLAEWESSKILPKKVAQKNGRKRFNGLDRGGYSYNYDYSNN